jgi:hypothetical protein
MGTLLEAVESMAIGGTQRTATPEECRLLTTLLPESLAPRHLLDLLQRYPLIGGVFELKAEDDESGSGVAMQWMSPGDTIQEMLHSMPGQLAAREGYLAFGTCLEGSGDPYFLKLDGENTYDPAVYRIYHEAGVRAHLTADDCVRVAATLSQFIATAATGKPSAMPVS